MSSIAFIRVLTAMCLIFSGTCGSAQLNTWIQRADFGGGGGINGGVPHWNNGDMITCMATRNERLFIGGATCSWNSFPLSTLDGISTSFLQETPPNDSTSAPVDLDHGFIAQLSWVHTVGIEENQARTGADQTHAYMDDAGAITVFLPSMWTSSKATIDLYDAKGSLVGSLSAFSAGNRLTTQPINLADGLYAGRVRGTGLSFKVMKQ